MLRARASSPRSISRSRPCSTRWESANPPGAVMSGPSWPSPVDVVLSSRLCCSSRCCSSCAAASAACRFRLANSDSTYSSLA
jgi:hypothetical protein